MHGLSLCSGVGGDSLGLKLAVPEYRTVCYVEIEAYTQDILLTRMADGVLDRAPIWGDLKQFNGRPWRGLVDLIHGGYPCQPFSVAGKRAGVNDSRHLWPDIARIVNECEPEWCFFENVAGHLTLGFDVVARDLEAMGYRIAAGLFTAAEVGAPHRRQRLFILARRPQRDSLAYLDSQHGDWRGDAGAEGWVESPDGGGAMVHPDGSRLEGRDEPEREDPDEWFAWPPGPTEHDKWARVPEILKPAVRRVVDGFPHRVDRLKALGNAVVPEVVALAWRSLSKQLTD